MENNLAGISPDEFAIEIGSRNINFQASFLSEWGNILYCKNNGKYQETFKQLIENVLQQSRVDKDETAIDFLRALVQELNVQTGRSR